MPKIKLNADVIVEGTQGVNFVAPFDIIQNTIKKLKATVYFHQMEYIRKLDVVIDEEGNAYCEAFDCSFAPAEYIID